MDYEYQEQHFSVEIAEALIISTQVSATGAKRETIIKFLLDTHREKGGFGLPDSEDEEEDIFDEEREIFIVERALLNLSKKAKASHIEKNAWRIAKAYQWIFGKGKHWVYLYYFSEDKQDAESQGKSIWQCRIGKTDSVDTRGNIKYKAPENRVDNQTRSYRQKPITALLIRADRHVALERAIQNILTVREQDIPNAPGNSWFWTSPSGVVKIVAEIDVCLLSPISNLVPILSDME